MSKSDNQPPKLFPRPGPSVVLPADLLQNSTPEPLKIIVTPYLGVSHLPSDVQANGPAFLVFQDLLECFKKQGYVAEGLLANVMWGFEQSGRDIKLVAHGLSCLRQLGYVGYSDPLGVRISEHGFNPDIPIWIRYLPKFTALMIRK